MIEDQIAAKLGMLLERSESTLQSVRGLDRKLEEHLAACVRRHGVIDVKLAQACTEKNLARDTVLGRRWLTTTLIALIAALVALVAWIGRGGFGA